MKRRFLTAVAVLGLLLVAGQAVARLLNFAPGQVLMAIDLTDLVRALTGGIDTTPIDVNCAAGDRIMNVLSQALPGSVIRLSGTCAEVVLIHTPRLTLDGQGSAIIDGGGSRDGIFVAGARGVQIKNLTVQNGRDGIRGKDGAALTLDTVTVRNNSRWGVLIENNATAFLTGSTVQDNGQDGVAVENKSSAVIDATVIKNNTEDGVVIKNGSSARISNSTVESNKEEGISIDNGSSAEISSNTRVQSNGINSTATIKFSGISVKNNSSADIEESTITLNKVDGVVVEGASSAIIDRSTITSNTEVGVSGENGATVTIRGTPSQKSTITSNGMRDLEVLFGALFTIDQANTTYTTIHCQPSLSFARNIDGNLLTC